MMTLKRILLGVSGIIILALVLITCYRDSSNDNLTLKRIDSKNLSKTIITAYLEQDVRPGENIVYCATFQLAWNELKDNIVKENVQIEGAVPIVEYLNKSLSTKADISHNDYFATAGLMKDNIIQKINDTMKEKFKDEAPLLQERLERPNDLIVYAFLYKNMKFERNFESLENPVDFNSNGKLTSVKAFGITKYSEEKHSEIAKQVEVHIGSHSQIIKLKTASLGDEIILAKVKPERNLLKTIEVVKEHMSNDKTYALKSFNSLQIPKFNFDITHSYSELLNKNLKNKGFEDYVIRKAIQTVLFRLDEKGAVLKSRSTIRMVLGRKADLIFDEPFLVCLIEKGARYPYFAMWVDNPELMIRK